MMRYVKWKREYWLFAIGMLFIGLTGCKKKLLDPSNPAQVTVWNYYSGYQQVAFDELAAKFNETVGAEQGILVTTVAQGSINGLIEELNNAVNGKVGAQKTPDIVCIYPDMAKSLDDKGLLLPLDAYFNKQELDAFIPSFLEEGRLIEGGDLKIIPISKSTELLIYNKTDFDKFAENVGVSAEDMSTIEGVIAVAEKYYEWTDAMTPDIKEDGKAFYGRDSLENYFVNGTAQLGEMIFHTDSKGNGALNLKKEVMRKLWDSYYVPYINGYFTVSGRFRSDDVKVGKIVAAVGSSSGIDFYPTNVTLENDMTYPIEIEVMEPPVFEGGKRLELQQGAGYSVLKSDEKTQYAAVEFLKWMTKKEQNMQFAIGANYMPVTKDMLNEEALTEAFSMEENQEMSEILKKALLITTQMVEREELWVAKPFTQYNTLRQYFADSLQEIADIDREQVEKEIQTGKSRAEAVAPYLTDDYFEEWYQKIEDGASQILNQ